MTPSTSQTVGDSRLKGSGGFTRTRRLWSKAMDTGEPVIEWLIRICGWSAIFFVLAIFVFVFVEGAPVLGHLNLKEFFTSPNWRPTSQVQEQFGILALVTGTLSVTAVAMLIAVPFGLGAADYNSEFSTGKTKETLKIVIEMLAAIPSVVWGFIGYMVMGPLIIKLTGAPVGVNVLNGGIILALMSVPVIVSVSEDALRAVPDSFREAATAMGASKWEIVYRVLFPAAKSGLLAAVLLGVGRSFGETMAVLMATGHAVQIPHSVLDPVRTLTATIAAELGEAVRGDDHYRVLFVIGIVLFAFVFVVNVTADLIVKGIRGRQND
jgi:phosphate transport system permease protein